MEKSELADYRKGGLSRNTEQTMRKPMELIATAGLVSCFTVMLYINYWMNLGFPELRFILLLELMLFLGLFLGYFLFSWVGQSFFERYRKRTAIIVCHSLLFAGLAVILGAFLLGVTLHFAALCLLEMLMGALVSCVTLNWLRISTSTSIMNHSLFVGIAFLIALVIAAGVALLFPFAAQLGMMLLFEAINFACMAFVGKRFRGGLDELEELDEQFEAEHWRFGKEIIPHFLVDGIVFGLCMAYLIAHGSLAMALGFLFAAIGAGIVVGVSAVSGFFHINTLQRISLPVILIGSLLMTSNVPIVGYLGAALTMGLWAMFMAVNYATLIYKCLVCNTSRAFYTVSRRMAYAVIGYCVGWCLAGVLVYYCGFGSEIGDWVILAVAIMPVVVYVAILPNQEHHYRSATREGLKDVAPAPATTPKVVTVNLSESELFEQRCQAVAKLYHLSQRESDILRFLAKGRNVAYMQEEFVLSPYTIKSHIYNIYRKTEIHSQQRLMDLVENFPLDSD